MLRTTSYGLVALLAGCTDPAEPSDPIPTTRTVTAHDELTLRAADGASKALPVDLDPAVVHAYSRGEDGTWRIVGGEGTSEGTLSIEAVPVGGGWLRVDYFDASAEPRPRNEYFWIDGDEDVALDLGTWRVGRADVKRATTAPTELELAFSGLVAWQPGLDLAVVYAPNASFVNVFSHDGDGITGMPIDGSTASTLRVDWASALAAPLLDGQRGDRTYAMQFRFRQMSGVFVGAPVRAAELPSFVQHDGVATQVTAALGAASPLRVRVAMDRSAFDQQRPYLGRVAGAPLGRGFAISSTPSVVTEEYSLQSLPAELVVIDGDGLDGVGLLDLGDVDVASPFPANSVYGRFVTAYRVLMSRDDGFVEEGVAEVGVITNELPAAGKAAAPIVGAVRDITVAGRAVTEGMTGVGLAPTIAWVPSPLGTPTEYEVKVLAPGGTDPTYGFLYYPAAIFHVPGDQTSLALPPDVLVDGLPYVIAIRALANAASAETRATTPRAIALPYGWADTITPSFKP